MKHISVMSGYPLSHYGQPYRQGLRWATIYLLEL